MSSVSTFFFFLPFCLSLAGSSLLIRVLPFFFCFFSRAGASEGAFRGVVDTGIITLVCCYVFWFVWLSIAGRFAAARVLFFLCVRLGQLLPGLVSGDWLAVFFFFFFSLWGFLIGLSCARFNWGPLKMGDERWSGIRVLPFSQRSITS